MPVAAPERPRAEPRDGTADADLVAHARAGDDRAYAAIYARYHRSVHQVARARLGAQGDPADVVQEAFTAAWRRLDTLRDPDRLHPWLMQIARRTAIDHGRRYRRRPVDLGDDLIAPVEDDGPSPEDLAELTELAARLDVAVAGLSRRDATAIVLAARFGLGPEGIAEALRVTPGNAKVILHRARRRLRAALDAG